MARGDQQQQSRKPKAKGDNRGPKKHDSKKRQSGDGRRNNRNANRPRRNSGRNNKHDNKQEKKKTVTAEDLDADMNAYWGKSDNKELAEKKLAEDKEIAAKKLDDDMDSYWENNKKEEDEAVVDEKQVDEAGATEEVE